MEVRYIKRINNIYIVTQNADRDVIFGDLLIQNGRIEKIIPKMEEPIYGMVRVATPAFHNLHMHLGETIFRGQCDGMNLFEYLDVSHLTYTKPEWKARESDVHRLSGYLSFMEAIRNGCGIFACGRGWDEAEKMGVKANCLFPVIQIDKLEHFYNGVSQIKHLGEYNQGRIKDSIFLQSLYLIEEEKIDEIAEYMEQNQSLKLFIHVAETQKEIDFVRKKYNCTPIEFLHRKKLLSKRIFCVHCVHLVEHDYELLQQYHVNVILCPVSNLKLRSGYPQIKKFVEYGINLLVSTDGFATNNSASILEELKLIGITCDQSLTNDQLLDMITTNAAKSLSDETNAGELVEGAVADISIFEVPSYLTYDTSKIINHLIYDYIDFRCVQVLIDGRVIFNDGQYTGIDQEEVLMEYTDLVRNCFGKRIKEKFHIGVKGILCSSDKVLLVKRSGLNYGTNWEFPGGAMEKGENPEETLHREVREETGINDIEINSMAYASNYNDVIIIAFICKVKETKVKLSIEHERYLWATEQEMRQYLPEYIQQELTKHGVWNQLTR